MKISSLLSILQLLLVIFLSIKVISFDAELEKISVKNLANERTTNQQTTPLHSPDYATHTQPTVKLAEIRQILREELSKLQPNIIDTALNHHQQKPQTIDSEKIAAVNHQVISYMNDGVLSELDLANIDQAMVDLNHQERQQVLNHMAKSASENAIIFGHAF